MLGVEAEPEISTMARPLRARGGKVYIDFGQNGHGQTIVAPVLGAAAARRARVLPARVARGDRRASIPRASRIKTLPARFDKMADPLAPVLGDGIDMAAALERIEAAHKKPSPLRGEGRVRGGGVSG